MFGYLNIFWFGIVFFFWLILYNFVNGLKENRLIVLTVFLIILTSLVGTNIILVYGYSRDASYKGEILGSYTLTVLMGQGIVLGLAIANLFKKTPTGSTNIRSNIKNQPVNNTKKNTE